MGKGDKRTRKRQDLQGQLRQDAPAPREKEEISSSSAFLAPADRQAERLQLAVEVRALQAGVLRDVRHAAVLAREQVLEVQRARRPRAPRDRAGRGRSRAAAQRPRARPARARRPRAPMSSSSAPSARFFTTLSSSARLPGQRWWRSAFSAATDRRRGGQARASTSCASISAARSGTSSANSRSAGSLSVSSAEARRACRRRARASRRARARRAARTTRRAPCACRRAPAGTPGSSARRAPRRDRSPHEQDAAGGARQQFGGRLGQQLGAVEERRARRREQAREQFRPHAALAAQQQRRAGLRELRQALAHLGERRRAAERGERELARRGALLVAQRALHRGEQALQRDRLLQVVERADARRLDRGLDGAVAGHHHHGHAELAARGPFLEQRDAVGVRHPDVEQHQVRARCARAGGAPRPRSRRAAPGGPRRRGSPRAARGCRLRRRRPGSAPWR